jgi:hypothetical protein
MPITPAPITATLMRAALRFALICRSSVVLAVLESLGFSKCLLCEDLVETSLANQPTQGVAKVFQMKKMRR